ncbi:nuclear transport factor 2 family protein [uncultured Kordia sp.]|uniref:nuclear transport factor 2 family protein n=1 Tax=uncultured Kordia sp. TaxID=507699 RepID=UPI0026197FFB|nr:nuclear transport factor 2 family protein [uncultured Kordia sp.]
MKKTIVILVLLISTLTISNAQNNDYNDITTTVSYYLDGGTNNDFETVKKAFHEKAMMKFVTKDGYKEVNAIEFFKRVIKPGPKQNRKTSIQSITIDGNIAVAKLEIEYPTFFFIDQMSLLKINGIWKVVNKIYYRKNKNN